MSLTKLTQLIGSRQLFFIISTLLLCYFCCYVSGNQFPDVRESLTGSSNIGIVETQNMSVPLLSGKVFLLVTGASKGIGSQIAKSFGSLLGNESLVLLLARNASGLQKTANALPKGIQVQTTSVDLSIATADQFRDIIREALGPAGARQFEKAVIVHNAASIGDLTRSTITMTDYQTWHNYYDLNVFSPAVLNGVFMEFFNDTSIAKLVINLTSGAGIKPFAAMGYYCSGKAAREMFFKVFAVENPDVNVLNYSPGAVDTNLLQSVLATVKDPSSKEIYDGIKTSGSALTTEQTVNRLLEVLKSQNYKSGDHVDYFDDLSV